MRATVRSHHSNTESTSRGDTSMSLYMRYMRRTKTLIPHMDRTGFKKTGAQESISHLQRGTLYTHPKASEQAADECDAVHKPRVVDHLLQGHRQRPDSCSP
jgi:hypothetical protein